MRDDPRYVRYPESLVRRRRLNGCLLMLTGFLPWLLGFAIGSVTLHYPWWWLALVFAFPGCVGIAYLRTYLQQQRKDLEREIEALP